MQTMQGGDSLFLRGGTYDLSEGLVIRASGMAGKRTFIGSYKHRTPSAMQLEEESATLDFRIQPHFRNGVTIKGDHIHLCGIGICYAGYKGLLNEGSFNIMEHIDAYGNCDTGIQQKGGHSNLIIGCCSYNNFDYMTGSTDDADWGGNADGFADKQYEGSPGNTYVGCKAWNNSDDGWDFYQRTGGTTLIKDCVCKGNGPQEYDLSNHPRRQTDRAFLDQFDGEGIVVTLKPAKNKKNNPKDAPRQVRCSLAHFYNNGNGNGFKLGGNGTKHNVELTGCLAEGNTYKGFDQNSNAGQMTLTGCHAEGNGQNYGFYNDNGYTLIIKGCTSKDEKKSSTFKGANVEQKENSWN